MLANNIIDVYIWRLCTVKDMWEALEAKLGDSSAGRKLNVMEQLYDYKMFDMAIKKSAFVVLV
jgi:hypothetical protein